MVISVACVWDITEYKGNIGGLLVVWPLTESKKYWRNLNLAVAPRKYYVIINIASALLPGTVFSLEVFEQSREFPNLQEI